MKKSHVCMVGMFPPPLHGMSLINDYMLRCIVEVETPHVIDFSPRTLDRSIMVRLGKVFRFARGFVRFTFLMMIGQVRCVYFGLSGGYGQIYDAVFVGLARLFGKALYLHHHSYQYLNQPSWVAKWLMVAAGSDAVHIVACDKMSADLKRIYPTVRCTRIISGIAALELWDRAIHQRLEVKTLGFLSNISVEKGIVEFLEIAERAQQAELPLRFILAGPYQDDAVRQLVKERVALLENVTYLGPVYGAEKLKFFDSIEVFLFPTKYVNESEGLVIHEAMSRGVPVIAYSRGCIEQIISEQVGLKLIPSDDFVGEALKKIQEWLAEPLQFQRVSQNALRQFQQARILHINNIEQLRAELLGQ